ncbi:MAG: acetolactate synthase small subunit [Opitutales bacterium]
MRHTISALVENKFGVLARVAGMFSGRGFNIDTLNVGPTQDPNYSRITATLHGDDATVDLALRQLDKLVNVIEVKHFSSSQGFVARELVMVKMPVDPKTRGEIIQIADIFRGKIVDVSPTSIIIECTGNENKIRAFLEMIQAYGITEMARSGNLGLERRARQEETRNVAE